VPYLFRGFPGCTASADVALVPEDVAELIVGCLPTLKIWPECVEEIFDVRFPLDNVAQNFGIDLVRYKCVVNEFELSGRQFIQSRAGLFPLTQLLKFFFVVVNLELRRALFRTGYSFRPGKGPRTLGYSLYAVAQ
jgi:hypothetical protein